jgi:hypothetical protein
MKKNYFQLQYGCFRVTINPNKFYIVYRLDLAHTKTNAIKSRTPITEIFSGENPPKGWENIPGFYEIQRVRFKNGKHDGEYLNLERKQKGCHDAQKV